MCLYSFFLLPLKKHSPKNFFRSVFTSSSLRLHFVFTLSSLCLHFVFTLSSLRLHFVFTSSSLRLHFVFTSSSLCLHFVFTLSSLHFHCSLVLLHYLYSIVSLSPIKSNNTFIIYSFSTHPFPFIQLFQLNLLFLKLFNIINTTLHNHSISFRKI